MSKNCFGQLTRVNISSVYIHALDKGYAKFGDFLRLYSACLWQYSVERNDNLTKI